MMRAHHPIPRWLLVPLLVALVLPLLACNVSGLTAGRPPRWACPSPTPQPYGEAGPVKREWIECTTDPVTGEQRCETKREYYAIWEQEYAHLGGPPFPAPTPYGIVGTSYSFGQRVEIWPFHVTITARPGPLVTLAGVPAGTQQVYLVAITWINHTAEAIPMDYRARVLLRAITSPEGRVVTDSNWGLTKASLEASGMDAPPDRVPPGESQVTIPIIGPPGTPKTVDLRFLSGATAPNTTPTAIDLGTPTPRSAGNPDLRTTDMTWLTVQWSDAAIAIGPACGDPGALTSWADGGAAWGRAAPLGVAAPPGVSRLIHIVLNQVGKSYVWGAKGPETFDCSGLATWSYGQIGLRIPQGTAGQWPNMQPVEAANLQPGDLVFFRMQLANIDHVGVLVGDVNGNGQWDMVHAASPRLGVRIEYDLFESPYYRPRVAGFRTAR
jgi:cell wall-associated NlpC family hydrolase